MADHDSSSSLFGLEDPNISFVDETSTAQSNPSSIPSNDNTSRPPPPQPYYDAAVTGAWQFTATPPYDSYDPSATAPPAAASSYQTSSWNLPFDQDQQQQLQRLTVSGGLDNLVPPTLSPESLFTGPVISNASAAQVLPDGTSLLPRPINSLTPALQEKLRNIAMPPHLQYHSPKSASSPDSAAGEAKTGILSSPDGAEMSSKASRKRKSSAEPPDEMEDEDDDDPNQPVKKTAHNMIEKRYRTNLNDKIAALRDSVPSLRIMSKSARGEDTTEDREELHGLTPAHKLNKATVLSKATEYIRHLEKRNNRLLDENSAMQARIAAFEKLFMAGAMNGAISPMQQPPTPIQYGQEAPPFVGSPMSATPDGSAGPAGMIQVPDDMKRIISAQMAAGQAYPVPQQPYRGPNPTLVRQQQIQQQQQQMQQGRWNNAGPYFGKLMVGSLAGLMILEAVRESEVSNEKTEGRGLFAVPFYLFKFMASGLDVNVAGYHLHTSLRVLLLLGTMLWIFVPSLFASAQPKQKKRQKLASMEGLEAAPSLASPIHVRRQAWLTAIQTVWVPRHNFLLEAAALILKTIKLSLRNTIGIHGYQLLTGLTEEQETARVKAWSIALDSQLAGGDDEINMSRLVLTLLASGTLPDTPSRLMLKALHIRVLLRDLSENKGDLGLSKLLALKLARARWNQARQLNRLCQASEDRKDDELPVHLAALVEQDCDDVLNDYVIQRAHNLAFNEETTHNVLTLVDGMDDVVEDPAIGSPLDALSAWYSAERLNRAMGTAMMGDEEMREERDEDIEIAVSTSPIGSTAQARAIIARTVFVDSESGHSLEEAVKLLGQDKKECPVSSPGIIDTTWRVLTLDLRVTVRCAVAISKLRKMQNGEGSAQDVLDVVETIMTPTQFPATSFLSCTASMHLAEQLFALKPVPEIFHSSLERLAGTIRVWIGATSEEKCGASSEVLQHAINRCLDITRNLVGMDLDTGYGSLSECEGEDDC